MGGLQGVPFLQGQQPPDDTSDLENRAAQAPQQLGQALQNQQQQPPQQQAQPQGQPQPDSSQLESSLLQQATPKQGPQGGPVRRALQNFFSGMGNSMMHEAGLPTEYEQQQKALANYTNLKSVQGLAAMHQASAAANTPSVPIISLDGKVATMPDGSPALLPPAHAAAYYGSLNNASARQTSAETALHKTITVPGVGAFNWDDQQNKYVPVQGGQIPQHQLAPGEAEKLGFPAGTAQIPEALYAQAARTSGTTSTQTKFLPDGAGGFIQVQATSGRKYNATTPSTGAPATGGTPRTSAPPNGAGNPFPPGHVSGLGPIYAFDPKTNDTVMTTQQEAAQNGYTNPRKVSQTNIENDRQLNNRLYDVAAKMKRYEDSINTPITDTDRAKIADLLGTDKLQFGAFGAHLPTDWLTKLTQATSVANLSPAAQQRLINYYNVREAMTGYTRVLTGSGRSNETNLQLNLQAMPDPIMPDNVTKMGINQFKQNIAVAGQGLPRMPGIQRAQDVLGQQQSSAPAMRFTEGSTQYDIPADKVERFRQLHPQAVPNAR